jgi:hypothetical protein
MQARVISNGAAAMAPARASAACAVARPKPTACQRMPRDGLGRLTRFGSISPFTPALCRALFVWEW